MSLILTLMSKLPLAGMSARSSGTRSPEPGLGLRQAAMCRRVLFAPNGSPREQFVDRPSRVDDRGHRHVCPRSIGCSVHRIGERRQLYSRVKRLGGRRTRDKNADERNFHHPRSSDTNGFRCGIQPDNGTDTYNQRELRLETVPEIDDGGVERDKYVAR